MRKAVTWELRPTWDSTYICRRWNISQSMSDLEVRVIPPVAHHISMYRCNVEWMGSCGHTVSACHDMLFTFSYPGDHAQFSYPAGTGSESPGRHGAIVQIHLLASPNPVSVTVVSNFASPTTRTLRWLEHGPRTFEALTLPPLTHHVQRSYVCYDTMQSKTPKILYALAMHMHTCGTRATTRWGYANENFIAHDGTVHLLPNPVNVAHLPWYSTCVYNTSSKKNPVRVGPHDTDEMCFAYALVDFSGERDATRCISRLIKGYN